MTLKSIKSAMSIGFRSNYDPQVKLPSIGSTLLDLGRDSAQAKSKRGRRRKRRVTRKKKQKV